MEEINDAIKSDNQEHIDAAAITTTTIVPTMTTVTTGNGTDVTQIATQIVDESDQHISAHDTFTTLEKASYEPTVPEQDIEYNENDSLEPSQKVFEHMVELQPYNHDLGQFIETNSNETVDEIKRKITPETNPAKEAAKKNAEEEKTIEEKEKEDAKTFQVEQEKTQIEQEKMEIVDEEEHPVQCNNEVANQDLLNQKKSLEPLQEDIVLTSVQEQMDEEKVELIKMVEDGDNNETTSIPGNRLSQPEKEEKEPEDIPEKQTEAVKELKLHEAEIISAVVAETNFDREPETNAEQESLKADSKLVPEAKPELELDQELDGDTKCEQEPEAQPVYLPKFDPEPKLIPQLEIEPKTATEQPELVAGKELELSKQQEKEADIGFESKSDTEQEHKTKLDTKTRSGPRSKRESRSRRVVYREHKPQSKPFPKPELEQDHEKEKEEKEEQEEIPEQKLGENKSKLDEVAAEPVEEITPRSTRPRRQTKALPPPSPQQLETEPEPKRPSKRSLAKEFVEEEQLLERGGKTLKPARATSSRVYTTNTSTPIPQKDTTAAMSRPMAIASQNRGKANSYGEDGIKKFICHDCDYSTDRLNNIVYHKKSGCKAFQSYWNQSVESYKKDLIKSPKSNKKRFTR